MKPIVVQRFMELTALVLGAAALVLIFAPELALAQLGIAAGERVLLLAQLYGAALFGLAMNAWMARTMLLGGIYGRAIVMAGLAHAAVGVFALLHALRSTPGTALEWIACAVYACLALAFATLMFGQGPAAP